MAAATTAPLLQLLISNTSSSSSSSPSSSSLAPPLSYSAQIGISILVLAFVLGFPGNLFVVWSVCCQVKKRSVTCLLVLNLAVADALVLLSAPFMLRYLAARRGWEFGSAVCKLVHYLSSVNMYVSIYLIALMSADRWLAVTRPFASQRMRTKRSLLAILLGVWVFAFALSLPMPFYRSNRKVYLPTNASLYLCQLYHWDSAGHQVFQFLTESVMSFLLPFSLILACYTSVLLRLRSAVFQRKGQSNRLILLIVGAFALFWLPYHVVNFMQVAGLLQRNEAVVRAAKVARPNVTAFAFLSSAVNPVLYVFAGSSHIRRAGLGFMGKLFEGTYSETRSSMSSRLARSLGKEPDPDVVPGGAGNKGGRSHRADAQSVSELKTLAIIGE